MTVLFFIFKTKVKTNIIAMLRDQKTKDQENHLSFNLSFIIFLNKEKKKVQKMDTAAKIICFYFK